MSVKTDIGISGMTAEELDAAVKAHPFVAGLPLAYVRPIVGCARFRSADRGDYLWRQGQRNTEIYLLLEGEIALEIAVPNEGKLGFETIGAGDIAGCTGLFHNARWGFDGRAATAVRAVVLNSRALRAAIEADPEFGYRIVQGCAKSMVKRLNANRLRLVEAHGASLP